MTTKIVSERDRRLIESNMSFLLALGGKQVSGSPNGKRRPPLMDICNIKLPSNALPVIEERSLRPKNHIGPQIPLAITNFTNW